MGKRIFYLEDEVLAKLTMMAYRRVAIETLFSVVISKDLKEEDFDMPTVAQIITDYSDILRKIDELIASVVGAEILAKGNKVHFSYDLDTQVVLVEGDVDD